MKHGLWNINVSDGWGHMKHTIPIKSFYSLYAGLDNYLYQFKSYKALILLFCIWFTFSAFSAFSVATAVKAIVYNYVKEKNND